jgi:hypothetical protein
LGKHSRKSLKKDANPHTQKKIKKKHQMFDQLFDQFLFEAKTNFYTSFLVIFSISIITVSIYNLFLIKKLSNNNAQLLFRCSYCKKNNGNFFEFKNEKIKREKDYEEYVNEKINDYGEIFFDSDESSFYS